MAVTFRFEELAATIKALHELPEELTGEARKIVEGWGNAAVVALRSAYPVYTGNLRQHVTAKTMMRGPFGIDVKVRNTARHAHIFERGTRGKKRYTKKGYHRGIMPAGNVFVPTIIRIRRKMYLDLKAMLERAGFKVSGDA
jgi:Bacteriophage HK97-gp10, putative tail-component